METHNTVLQRYGTQHIPCMGTKRLAIAVNYLHESGGSAAYKGIDVSLSLDVEIGSLP